MNRQILSRAGSRASAASEWLVLLFLLVAATPPLFLHHESLTVVPELNLLDDSWLLDTSYKAANGICFGRDVAFTYGPLFQWLSSAPSRWLPLSMGSVYATWYTLPFFLIVLATFLSVRLLLPQAAAWRRALLLLLAVAFCPFPDVRVSLCLLAFVLFLRFAEAAVLPAAWLLPRALAAAAICLLAFLLSADTGLYAVAALLLCAVAGMITKGKPQRLTRLLVTAAICFTMLMVVTNHYTASFLDFRYWRASLAIAAGYRWFEPLPMLKQNKYLLWKVVCLGVVFFAAAWWWRDPRGRWTRRPTFLLAGFCLAFVMMQTAVVRSDQGHVLIGVYPMIFLCGAIALDEPESSRLLAALLPVGAVLATLALARPYPMFRPGEVRARFQQFARPMVECPQGWQEFDRACFVPGDFQLLSAVSVYVGLHAGPGDPIVIFPYETAFALASRHPVAGGVLQSYLVNGKYLTDLELSGLLRKDPQVGLYFPDGILSRPIDAVPNFTRSPELWFYLVRHYRRESSPAPGVLGLLQDDSRESLALTEEAIGDRIGPVRIVKRNTNLDLGPIHWPTAGADFLKLRVRVNYPSWWRVRKPSKYTLRISFADGKEKLVGFVLEPDHPTDLWFYPQDDEDMARYFATQESEWRSPSASAITGIQLQITPYDWLSVVPENVSVDSVAAVTLTPQLRDQKLPAVAPLSRLASHKLF